MTERRKIRTGDQELPSGELEESPFLKALRRLRRDAEIADQLVQGADQEVLLDAYSSSIDLAKAWLADPQRVDEGWTESTIRKVSEYRMLMRKALSRYDHAMDLIQDRASPVPLKHKASGLSIAATAVGAVFSEAAALGAIKPARDKQVKAARNRSAKVQQVNESRKSLTRDQDVRQLQANARSLVGASKMAKIDIVKTLKRSKQIPLGMTGLSDRRIGELLGKGFGQRST